MRELRDNKLIEQKTFLTFNKNVKVDTKQIIMNFWGLTENHHHSCYLVFPLGLAIKNLLLFQRSNTKFDKNFKAG